MADYSYSEIIKMQNDAVRRVEEMQKRARETAGLASDGKKNAGSAVTAAPQKTEEQHRVPMPDSYLDSLKGYAESSSYSGAYPAKSEMQNKTSENNFAVNAEIDSDKALILSLVLLLSQEHADELLILSLLYMLT